MASEYEIMVWDPHDVGGFDDSFQSTSWDTAVNATETIIDADYVHLLLPEIGEAIIPAGETSVSVPHGAGLTPSQMHVWPKDFLGGRKYWVPDTITATHFEVHIDNPDIIDHAFWWADPLDDVYGVSGGPGYKQKNNISIDPSTHPYLVLALWGSIGSSYYIEVYDGSWQIAVEETPVPLKYGIVFHYLGDLGFGTITAIRLGIAPIPGAELTYDFFEFHTKPPHLPEDLTAVQVSQHEESPDVFELEAVTNRYVGRDVALLMNFEEDEGNKVFDESVNEHVGTLSYTPDLLIYEDDETFWSTYGQEGGSYNATLSEETTIVRKGASSLKVAVGAGTKIHVGSVHVYGSPQDWSLHTHLYVWIYGTNSGDTLRIFMYDTTPNFARFNFTDDWTGWKLVELELAYPNGGDSGIDWSDIEKIYFAIINVSGNWTLYMDRMWLSRSKLLELYEDDEDFWLTYGAGTGSYANSGISEETTIVKSGHSSIKIETTSGSDSRIGIYKNYGADDQDWSIYDFISFELYGTKSDDAVEVWIYDDGLAHLARWQLTDDWNGWKRIVLPIANPDSDTGVDWTIVERIYIFHYATANTKTWYLDRLRLVQGPAFAEAEHGMGLQFVGNTTSIFNTSGLSISNDEITVIVGVKDLGQSENWGNILEVSLDGNNRITIESHTDGTGKCIVKVGGSSYNGPHFGTLGTTKFRNLAIVCSKAGGWVKSYTDGVLNGTVNNSYPGGVTLTKLENIGYNFEGILDYGIVFERVLSDSEIARINDNGPPTRVYIRGRYIRIALAGDNEKEKVFAGIIEEAEPGEGHIMVRGGDFQRLALLATKSVDYDEEPIEDAAADLVSGIPGITTGRVEAPVSSIEVTKRFQDIYISNAMDELIQIPPKEADKEWRWGINYGRDLRFRPFDASDVRKCTTQIVEGTNLLVGILRPADIYNLANQVVAISGLIKHPQDDEYCESLIDWSTDDIQDFTLDTNRTTGTWGLRIYAKGTPNHWIERAITEKDLSSYKRLIIDAWWDDDMEDEAVNMYVQCYSAGGGAFEYQLIESSQKGLSTKTWNRYDIPLDHPMWEEKYGTPSWTDINAVRIICVNASSQWFQYYIDNVHFEVENIRATSTDPTSEIYEDRVVVYQDVQIKRIEKIQDLADGIQAMLKEAANRTLVPALGEPDLQRGREVTVDVPSWNLDGTYYIAEAIHRYGVGFGYRVDVLLSKSRISLTQRLVKTMQTELRRSSAGNVALIW